MLNSSISTV